MSCLKAMTLSVLWVAVMLLSPSIRAEDIEEQWSEVLYFTGSSGFAIPGDRARYVGIWETRGLAQFVDGNVARMKSAGTMDLTDGMGPYAGYVLYTFDEGSSKFGRIEGVVYEILADGGNRQWGMLVYEGGTGRFSGISGKGTFRARQYGPAKDGGETVIDVSARFSLPN